MSTTITIDTHEVSRRECAALIVLLNALHPSGAAEPIAPTVVTVNSFGAQKCREAYENTYHKVAADIPFDVWEFVWKKAQGVSATSPGKYVAVRTPSDMPTPEITALLADLNAELYSRRVIKPEDNPAAGVELPAAAVAGMDDMARHGAEAMARDFIKKEVIAPMVEAVGTLNLAGIFASSAGGSTSVDPANPPEPKITDMVVTMLDKNGLPWDSRIHAASKAINADGTWRQKRGVAPELVATVEAQLRGVMVVPVPDTHGSPELDEDATKLEAMGGDAGPTIGDIDLGQNRHEGQVVGIAPPPPPSPSTVLPPPPPVTTPAGDPTIFPELVAYITAQKVAGKLTQAQLDAALQIIGVQGALPVMAARPDLIPTLVAKLRVLAGA